MMDGCNHLTLDGRCNLVKGINVYSGCPFWGHQSLCPNYDGEYNIITTTNTNEYDTRN